MGVLQDPSRALDQIEAYLDDRSAERFPGAYELAAGNLCRQTLEQIYFVLCTFSQMPLRSYVRKDWTIHTLARLGQALDKVSPSGITYWECARLRAPRIADIVRAQRQLRTWARHLNEPSHFSAMRRVDDAKLRRFVAFGRRVFKGDGWSLVLAAANETFSGKRIRATIKEDGKLFVGQTVIVRPSMIEKSASGQLTFKTPQLALHVISATDVPRGPWPRNTVVWIQGVTLVGVGVQCVLKDGTPYNFKIHPVLNFGKSEGQLRYFVGHLRRIGMKVERLWHPDGAFQVVVSNAADGPTTTASEPHSG